MVIEIDKRTPVPCRFAFTGPDHGAAYDSEPHRVVRSGEAGSMNRERPKSVSLMSGADVSGWAKASRARRMSVVSDYE